MDALIAARTALPLLPELSACGYIPNPTVWQYAETLTGPTLRWLRVTAQRLGIYLGAGFAEVDGTHFHNSFALVTPDGDLAGCARKTMSEAYCFRYGHGRHFFTTDIGRTGAGH